MGIVYCQSGWRRIGPRGDIYKRGDCHMSPVTKKIIELIDMSPEQEQQLAFELIKRMVLARDSDFSS